MTTAMTNGGDGGAVAAGFLGSLADTPLADVFRRIAVEELSGDLQVTGPSFIKTVYFDRGFVVFASSDQKDDRLGESMIEVGRISRHEFALASMLMKSTNKKFGKVLVEAGIVNEEELGRYVASQVNRIVLSLFLAKEGVYSFDERPCAIPMELMVSLSVYRILIEGVRRMSRKSLVLAGLPPLDTKLRIAEAPPFTLNVDRLRPEEKSVLRSARDGATIRAITAAVGGHEGAALRACYGMLCGGILEIVVPDPQGRLLRVQEETGTFVLSEIKRRVSRTETPESSSEAPEVSEPESLPVEASEAPSRRAVEAIAAAEPHEAPLQPSGGFTVSDLYDWLRGFWNWMLGLFGFRTTSVPLSSPEPPRPVALKSPAEDRTLPIPEPPGPPERSEEPNPEISELLSVGVPSWSLKDAPDEAFEPVEPASDESEPSVAKVGAPSWSLKDDPDRSSDDVVTLDEPAEPVEAELPSGPPERLDPPHWSIQAGPEDALADLDNELFIDEVLTTDEDASVSSLLSQIPVEEVEFDETNEIEGGSDLGLEIEIDVEDDEAAPDPELEPELEDAAAPAPVGTKIPSATAFPEAPASGIQPAPSARVSPAPRAMPTTSSSPSPSTDFEPDSSDNVESAAHEREMQRMKQSGGEARLVRDVKLHFRMQDWDGAVPLLEQLVRISPGKAFYRGMLARAMSRNPATRKDAEEHFIEALRLSPQDPELHYWLGLYYKSFGLNARALTEFRTTLRINPKHEGARRQLGGAGKKDDALGNVFKKLFG